LSFVSGLSTGASAFAGSASAFAGSASAPCSSFLSLTAFLA